MGQNQGEEKKNTMQNNVNNKSHDQQNLN